jgi:thiosulfate/3-mercaptopyruvate sulfurtransferase
MSVPRPSFSLLLVLLFISSFSWAGDGEYKYISASDLEARLTTNQPTAIVDIQVEEEFAQHHIKGAIPTYAYPVKSDADRVKLDTTVERLKTNEDPVVVVCPRGAGGATRTYDYLLQQGISSERLVILENGQGGWSYTPLTESK